MVCWLLRFVFVLRLLGFVVWFGVALFVCLLGRVVGYVEFTRGLMVITRVDWLVGLDYLGCVCVVLGWV